MENRIKSLNLLQYVFCLAFLLIFLFASLGSIQIDLDIQYIRAPENGFSGDIAVNLNFGIVGKLVMIGILAAELIVIHIPKFKTATLAIVLCAVRSLPFLWFAALDVLFSFQKNDSFMIHVTVFDYLLLLLCVASQVCHGIHHKDLVTQTKYV